MSGVPPRKAKIERDVNTRYSRSSDAIIIKCGSDATNTLDNVRSQITITIHCGSDSEKLSRFLSLKGKELKKEPVDGLEIGPGEQSVATTSADIASQVTRSKLGGVSETNGKVQKKNSDGTFSPMILPHKQNFVHSGPALEVSWNGCFEVFHNEEDIRFCEGIVAHPSAKVSRKALEFSKQMAPTLNFTMYPRSKVWPKLFQNRRPDKYDIALYFYPGKDERSKRQYSSMLKFIEKRGLVLRSGMGKVQLLVFPSKLLNGESQTLNGSKFLWGVFICTKGKPVTATAHLSSPPVVSSQ